ncbi:MAG: tetraacyldisaccharide 4'-kinase [Planctomycetes bacterium]|nr:tetraacyldisaccharide 4'-kinase [Planctomycetota bacterium]
MLSWPYSAVVRVRNYLYTSGRLKTHTVGVPVICVGNLTTGGTGKTPLVVWLCRYLQEKQICCSILTRGYKTRKGEASDEPALLAALCPGVAVVVNPDRVTGAAEAICWHDARVLVMDDGFQHRRLSRDLDIVAVDATRMFGYGRLLPAGLLREPVSGLRRAHAVVLTRCDQVSADTLKRIEEEIRRINPDLVVARSIHAPVGIRTLAGTEMEAGQLRGQRIFAFCGVGNPQSFFHTVEQSGAVLAGSIAYDDHHRYAVTDLERIYRKAARRKASLILTTQKDWTKIAPLASPGEPRLAYLAVELQITAGQQPLTALIDRILGGTMPQR